MFYGVDSYTLPHNPITTDTRLSYWYGSCERKEREAMAEKLKTVLPKLKTKMFDGCNHAQFCLGKPKEYAASFEEFLTKRTK